MATASLIAALLLSCPQPHSSGQDATSQLLSLPQARQCVCGSTAHHPTATWQRRAQRRRAWAVGALYMNVLLRGNLQTAWQCPCYSMTHYRQAAQGGHTVDEGLGQEDDADGACVGQHLGQGAQGHPLQGWGADPARSYALCGERPAHGQQQGSGCHHLHFQTRAQVRWGPCLV